MHTPVETEIVEKRSRFIANLSPAKNEIEAKEHVNSIKSRFSDATHNVFAYYIDHGTFARYSDDGEPQGTAGMPVLNALKMSGLTDICVVVTRYFGGILLGAGGLVRAYSAAARSAIEACQRVVYE
ncbi:MAG: YigZ family protein, partial [Clostridia bacterium]|nr:YigZ family protein [Clostridia bacterium]